MEIFQKLLLCLVIFVIAAKAQLTPRIVDGTPIDTFRRFPHHVTIRVKDDENGSNETTIRYCGGSIIGKQWILSSLGCVKGGSQLQIDFNRLHFNHSCESYSILIDHHNSVTFYPTEYDDLAIIKIPLLLQYSAYVKPIDLYTENTYSGNQFAVMPGFLKENNLLSYGMFEIISNQECESIYGQDKFDKYNQICTRGWQKNKNIPCNGDQGGGLIVGWPRAPKLFGVFSNSLDCESKTPAIYVKVAKYVQWIQDIISKDEIINNYEKDERVEN